MKRINVPFPRFKPNGEWMKNRIELLGLSQKGVAKKLGIHEATFNQKMWGHFDWLRWEMAALRDIFKMTDDEFIEVFFNEEK